MDRQELNANQDAIILTQQQSMIILQSQPQSQHLLQQQLSPSPVRKSVTAQAEYFDISSNQPSTKAINPSTLTPTIYLNNVRGSAKLDAKRVNVGRLRGKYNREHHSDKILHPRGFKFTNEQRRQLMQFFEQDRYPKPNDMQVLAYELNVKKEQIKNWFHDQRRKFKRLEQLAINSEAKKIIKSKYTRQQRQKLEEFFEKNFHPFPGDSRRVVNEIESKGSSGVQSKYKGTSINYNFSNMKGSVQSRGFKFSENQRYQLKESFLKDRYPSTLEMERLAQQLGVRKVQIKNWFHDQRRKVKRESGT